MAEQWRDIAGYDGVYQVSDQGQVRNTQTGKILQQGGKIADAAAQYNQSLKALLSLRQINQLDDYGVSVLLGAEEALGKKFSADGGVVAELAQ